MSLTHRVYGGKKSRNSKNDRGHCRIGGKKTLKKGGKRIFSLGGKSLKNRKKSKRRSKGGGSLRALDKALKGMEVLSLGADAVSGANSDADYIS